MCQTSRVRGAAALLGCLLSLGCLDQHAGNVDAQASEALALGIQGFARFDEAGNAVAGSVATTIGTSITGSRSKTGNYRVTFHGLAATAPDTPGQGGTLQVVAVGPGNARCSLASRWSYSADHSVVADVVCRSPGVGPINSGFFVYYGRGPGSSGRSAYALVEADASLPSAYRFSSSGAALSASRPAVGTYWVFLNAEARQQVQVTSLSPSVQCHAALRELGVTTVRCFNEAGLPVNAAFTLNQAGRDALALTGVGAFAQVQPNGMLDSRYEFNACPLGSTSARQLELGRYELTHTLVGESLGSYQLSAYDNGSGYCKLESITTTGTTATATAACFSASGAPADAGFVSGYAVYLGDCGGCPRSCEGGACVLGVCQPVTIASGVQPRSLSASASTVYFSHEPGSSSSSPRLMSVSRSGGALTTLVTQATAGFQAVDSVLVGPTHVYWYEAGPTSGVYRKPLTGGARSHYASGDHVAPAHGLSWASSRLFFVDVFNTQLYRVDGPSAKTPLLLPSIPNAYPYNLVSDSTHHYFTRDNGAQVSRVPLAGGTAELLASFSDDPSGSGSLPTAPLATDGVNVYFATSFAVGSTSFANRIYKVPVTGGSYSTFEWTSGLVTDLTIADDTLFWTVKSPGVVMSKPLGGGPTRTLATGENAPRSLFVDATTVFWANADAIRKVAR